MNGCTEELISQMMDKDMKLYEKILDTPEFSYCFNEIVRRAIAYDNLIKSIAVAFNAESPFFSKFKEGKV